MHSFTRKSRILRWHHRRKNLINNSRSAERMVEGMKSRRWCAHWASATASIRNERERKKTLQNWRRLFKTKCILDTSYAYLFESKSRNPASTCHYVFYGVLRDGTKSKGKRKYSILRTMLEFLLSSPHFKRLLLRMSRIVI